MAIVSAVFVSMMPAAVTADGAVLRCAYHNSTVPVEDDVTEDCKIETPGHGASFCFVLFSTNKETNEYEVSLATSFS